MGLFVQFLTLSVVYLACSAKSFPDYIELCSESDAKLNDCIREKANALILKLASGDEKHHIPALVPFKFTKIVTEIGTMHLELTDGKLYNLDQIKITSVEFNKKTGTFTFSAEMPKLTIKSHYETSGKISILPIEGKGPFECSFTEPKFTFNIKYDNMKRDSDQPIKYVSSDFDYTYNEAYLHFDNLFNGNKKLSDPVNKLINEEHQSLNKEFYPVFADTFKALVLSVARPILDGHKFSDIFKE